MVTVFVVAVPLETALTATAPDAGFVTQNTAIAISSAVQTVHTLRSFAILCCVKLYSIFAGAIFRGRYKPEPCHRDLSFQPCAAENNRTYLLLGKYFLIDELTP